VSSLRFLHKKPNLDLSAVSDTAEVIEYEDCSLDPPFIGPTTFFCRHTFRPKIKHVTVSSPHRSTVCLPVDHLCQSPPPEEVCSICREPYNPEAARRLPELFTMHFCPRDTCQTACHRECLSTHPIKKRPTCTDRKLSLLCSIPSKVSKPSASPSTSASRTSLLSLLSKSKPTPSQSQSGSRKRKRGSDADPLTLLRDLPSELIQLASQPIIKPTFGPSNVPKEPPKKRKGKRKASEPESVIHNVAGNITIVLKARVLVSDVLRGTNTLPRDWKKKIGWDGDTIPSVIVDDGENGSCPPLLCPTCGEHI